MRAASTPFALRVPEDQPTIQAAIDVASPGASIIVAPGVYHELLDFRGKAILVTSAQGPAVTVLDGDFSGPIVNFANDEGPGSILSGFSLRRGFASPGGAIALVRTSPSIISNIFEENWLGVGGQGAAIGGDHASPLLLQNVFRSNHSDDQNLSGIVSFINESSPFIANNLFLNSQGRALNLGLSNGARPKTINNLFSGNTTAIRVSAGADCSGVEFHNNILVRNGTALAVVSELEQLRPTWTHNLVHENGVNYSGLDDPTGTEGNLSSDPLFVCDVSGDYHLLPASPCIDTGDQSPGNALHTDFDSLPRQIGTNAAVDIGPFEFNPSIVREPCVYIQCPANIVVYAARGQASALVNYPPPVGSAAAAVISSPASGTIFRAGTNVVTCIATAGTNSQVCSFTVTVLTRPANDDFGFATVIPSLPFAQTQDTTLATIGAEDVFCGGLGASVWYRYAAREDADIYVDARASDYNVSVSAYNGLPTPLTQMGCAVGVLKFKATRGSVYHILLNPFFRAAGGRLNLLVRSVPPLKIQVSIDGPVMLDPKTGQATIRGRVKSNRPIAFSVAGTLSQYSGHNSQSQGTFHLSISCEKNARWVARVDSFDRPVRPGFGVLTATGFGFDAAGGDSASDEIRTVVLLRKSAFMSIREKPGDD